MKVAITSERSFAVLEQRRKLDSSAPSSARKIRGIHSATGMSRSSILRGVLIRHALEHRAHRLDQVENRD